MKKKPLAIVQEHYTICYPKCNMTTIFAFSDLHNMPLNANILNIMEESDYIFFCGDGLSGLSGYRDMFGDKFIAVKGNCDGSSDFSDERLIKIEDVTFLLTHGHKYCDKLDLLYHAFELKANCVLYGHTHMFDMDEDRGVKLINVGSLGSSRVQDIGYTYITVHNKNIFGKFVKTG